MERQGNNDLFNMAPPSVTTPHGYQGPLPSAKYSPDEVHSDEFDDAGALSEGEGDAFDQLDSSAGPKRKGRRAPSTAEKRANHNAIERARRESLNGRFMELAQALPNLNAAKRPSKNAIVVKSLEYVLAARHRESALEAQASSLRAEVNELRSKLGMAPRREVSTNVYPHHHMQPPAPPQQIKEEPIVPPLFSTLSPVPAPPSAFHPVQPYPAPPPHQSQHHTSGPYLPTDPIAAAYNGFVDYRRPSLTGSSKDGSDSESSLVHTPPSFSNHFPHHGGNNGGGHQPFRYGGHGEEAPRSQTAYPHASGQDYAGSCAAPAPPPWSSTAQQQVSYSSANMHYSLYA